MVCLLMFKPSIAWIGRFAGCPWTQPVQLGLLSNFDMVNVAVHSEIELSEHVVSQEIFEDEPEQEPVPTMNSISR